MSGVGNSGEAVGGQREKERKRVGQGFEKRREADEHVRGLGTRCHVTRYMGFFGSSGGDYSVELMDLGCSTMEFQHNLWGLESLRIEYT